MLFQPTNITPSLLGELGNGCVDIESSNGLTVTWQVNGNSPMTAIKIDITDAMTSPSVTYSTGVVTLDTPFSPMDASGNQQFYSYTIPRSSITSFTNGDTYFLKIRQYWSSTEYVDQMSVSQFITRATPTLTIGTITATSPSITITGTYSQAQSDVLNWARWQLTHIVWSTSFRTMNQGSTPGIESVSVNKSTFYSQTGGGKGLYRFFKPTRSTYWSGYHGSTLLGTTLSLATYGITTTGTAAMGDEIKIIVSAKTISDTGNMYGATTLSLSYDGLVSGEVYEAKLSAETASGVAIETAWAGFTASYTASSEFNGSISYIKEKSGMRLDFQNASSVKKVLLFREEYGANELDIIGEFNIASGYAVIRVNGIDCAVKNNQRVRYVAYYMNTQASASYIAVGTTPYATFKSWSWDVIACNYSDADNTYHPQAIYRFVNNVSSGSIGNNSGNNLLSNFTQYPTVQTSPYNFMSGTLSGLIGTVADGKYSDTVSIKNEIYKLADGYDALFLKSRKGDIWKIAVTGQIVMTTADATAEQAQTVQIPWSEAGSTDGVRIMLDMDDTLWNW